MLPMAVKFKMIFSLRSSKVGGLPHPTPPSLLRCRSATLIPPAPVMHPLLSPDSRWTCQRNRHGKDTATNGTPCFYRNLTVQNESVVRFAFLRRWSTWRIGEMTSPKRQTWSFLSYHLRQLERLLSDLGTQHCLKITGQNTLFCQLSFCIFYLVGLPLADIAALKGNSLRDKQKFSRLAKLSTLISKLNTCKCLIVPILISNGKILIFVWKNTGGWLHPRCKFVSKRSVQI